LLLVHSDVAADGLGSPFRRFGGDLQTGQDLHWLAALIVGACWLTSACMRRTSEENSALSISSAVSAGNWPL
jgi:hypothetical protein